MANINETPEIILPINSIKKCTSHMLYEYMTPRAKSIYIKKCKELMSKKMLSELYLDTLNLYASEYDRLLTIDAEIREYGEVMPYTDRYGNTRMVPHPLVKIRKDCMDNIITIGRRFGYTPGDLGKNKTPKVDDKGRQAEEFAKEWGL